MLSTMMKPEGWLQAVAEGRVPAVSSCRGTGTGWVLFTGLAALRLLGP